MNTYATVVLAAGNGTRMRSSLPKVLHPLAGRPLLEYVLTAIENIPATPIFATFRETVTTHRPVVVVGRKDEQIAANCGDRCLYAYQEKPLGTGHAVLAAEGLIESLTPLPETILVCYGDTPLVRSEMLAHVLVKHFQQQAMVTFLTAHTDLPSDYGRVVRDRQRRVLGIVEAKHASPEQLQIREVNSGVYCFNRDWLWSVLKDLPSHPTGEYYLTELIGIAGALGVPIATVEGSLDETLGVNDRSQLAVAEQIMRRRILERHMRAGVTITDLASTYIDDHVRIGSDTVILPGTIITGWSTIGSSCRIGPDTTIDQSRIADHCIVRNSVVEESRLDEGVQVGPFSHCRAGAHLGPGVQMGNFGEVKNSSIGAGSHMHHFSYLGDATVGERVNIAAGVITSNYDGKEKHRTIIGDGAFIGCDTTLVAPVAIGDHAYTGAGAVVDKDVPAHALVVGIPARLLRMLRHPEGMIAESSKKE
jgi:bifunctional UDP-N-acetylglucosamine pyrophosphorylase/glucosamine-1-phosphate N-acetyltransferase